MHVIKADFTFWNFSLYTYLSQFKFYTSRCIISYISHQFLSLRKIVYSDLEALTPEQYMKVITRKLTDIKAVHSPEQRGALIQVLEQVYRFTLGSLAGG